MWYNPLFNAPEPLASNSDLMEEKEADDGEPPEREEVDLDTIGMPQPPVPPDPPIDPLLEQPSEKTAQSASNTGEKPAEEIQILELHSKEPVVSYRNHVFRGTWCENIGTEMIFTPHDDNTPLPALRKLNQNIDLLAASATRINFREATLLPRERPKLLDKGPNRATTEGTAELAEDMPERYKRNGGIYIHIGGDKSGLRQPQAHFLEDLIALKRKRGETDDVTVQPLETRHNKLMVEDEEEERRRRKLQQDNARNARWRDMKRECKDSGLGPAEPERNYVPRRGRRGFPRPRARRAALIRRESGAISRFGHRTDRSASISSPTPMHWNETASAQHG